MSWRISREGLPSKIHLNFSRVRENRLGRNDTGNDTDSNSRALLTMLLCKNTQRARQLPLRIVLLPQILLNTLLGSYHAPPKGYYATPADPNLPTGTVTIISAIYPALTRTLSLPFLLPQLATSRPSGYPTCNTPWFHPNRSFNLPSASNMTLQLSLTG